jgi:hypothetical protein
MLFGQFMLNLSGTINVALFLITRPKLLLFAPPEMFPELEMQTGTAILLHTAQHERNIEMTNVGVMDDLEDRSSKFTLETRSFRDSDSLFRVGSTQVDV